MKLVWGRRARRDLHELIAFIAEDSVQAAEIVAARILKAAELLIEFPRGGRIGRVAGTRERIVGRTPYLLVYQIASGRVRILRVYHGARKWPARF
jgi:plasmid stabilization system protein ParE